jgi:CRISPR system Cascade subunit CasC
MRHLELHIIQSVPVACLNRDDLNSPKTAVFGGVQRARVSSQSWKRAIREMAKKVDDDNNSALFKGNRSRRLIYAIVTRLKKKSVDENIAIIIAEHVADIIETLDSKKDADGFNKIKTQMFFSDLEYDSIVDAITKDVMANAANVHKCVSALKTSEEEMKKIDDETKRKVKEKELDKLQKEMENSTKALKKAFGDKVIRDAIKSAQLKDAADIALFGRMVANDHSLTIEAASMFSHALSTHKVDNEIDFFAAVDDLQPKTEAGAGMTSTLEFNSATYYRFAALNLDMLADGDHLKNMTKEERQSVVRTFVEATIKAIPSARKNTMNGNTIPDYVLGVLREKGHPVQLVNAFESPMKSNSGYAVDAIKRLNAEYADLQETWGINGVAMATIRKSVKERLENGKSDDKKNTSGMVDGMAVVSLGEFLDRVVAHVI